MTKLSAADLRHLRNAMEMGPPQISLTRGVLRTLLDTAEENARLNTAIERALAQISGGLTYFTAEAKHAQLRDAQRTLLETQQG